MEARVQERELLDDLSRPRADARVPWARERAARGGEIFEHHHIAPFVIELRVPGARHAHGQLGGEVAVEMSLAHAHLGDGDEVALGGVEGRQLHEHARGHALASEREPRAARGARVRVEHLHRIDGLPSTLPSHSGVSSATSVGIARAVGLIGPSSWRSRKLLMQASKSNSLSAGSPPIDDSRKDAMAADATRAYVVITADSHAGASIDTYREYLDDQHQQLFDDWRKRYRNPQQKHIGSKKHKNWDDAERLGDMETEGIAGEVIFPNTVPPFFRSSVLICGNPSREDYPLWREGIRAHNRWLVDFCAEAPERRAGIGLVYLNDIDAATLDVQWIAKSGLRGGILLPHVPPDCLHIEQLYSPALERFWAVCQDTGVILNQHGGTGSPEYGPYKVSLPLRVFEGSFYSTRSLPHLLFSGVFERYPKLRYITTESGCAWVPGMLAGLDRIWNLVGRARSASSSSRKARRRPSRRASTRSATAGTARLAVAARALGAPRDRRRADSLGQRLPALRGHLPALAQGDAPRAQRQARVRGARDARRQRRAALRIRSRKLQVWADQHGPKPSEIAVPLAPDEFPKGTHTGAFMSAR